MRIFTFFRFVPVLLQYIILICFILSTMGNYYMHNNLSRLMGISAHKPVLRNIGNSRKNLRTIIFNSESSNCVLISWFLNIIPEFLIHAFLIHISRVNSEGHGTKGRNSTVKSKQHSWAGQYKKCVQYNLKLSSLI